MKFSLTEEQQKELNGWMKEQDQKVAEKQNRDEAYYGAIGGAYTYSFIPTNVGLGVSVRNCLTNETIDLTDYDAW